MCYHSMMPRHLVTHPPSLGSYARVNVLQTGLVGPLPYGFRAGGGHRELCVVGWVGQSQHVRGQGGLVDESHHYFSLVQGGWVVQLHSVRC